MNISTCFGAGKFKLWLSDYRPTSSLQQRDIYIYLPKNYETSNESYSVIYMHDGQNLFDPTRAFMGQTWQVEKTLNHLIANGTIPPVIVVALDNTSDRLSEYTPTTDRRHGGGMADAYLGMITQHLIPKVDTTFRSNLTRGMIGSSLGGLVSLYAIKKHPDVFSKVAALSPSIWWDDREILNMIRTTTRFPHRLWVDGGTLEEDLPFELSLLEDVLRPKLSPERFKVFIQKDANHSEKFWAMRLPYVLHYLLRD